MFPIKYESSMKPCILELETLYWMAEIMSVSTGRFSKVLVFCSQLTPSPTPITQWDQSLQLEHSAISHWSQNEFSKCLGADRHIFLPFIDLILSCPSRPTAACLLVNGLTGLHLSAILHKLCLLGIPLMLCFVPQNQTIDCVPHPESSIWCSFPSKKFACSSHDHSSDCYVSDDYYRPWHYTGNTRRDLYLLNNNSQMSSDFLNLFIFFPDMT